MKSHVVKDAFRQILGRLASAVGGFLVVKLMTPYLGPIRFGDYSTVLKYFAIWSALADFGVYVIALRELGKSKAILERPESTEEDKAIAQKNLENYYGKFVTSRFFMIVLIYTVALVIAYMLPAYTANPYLIRGLPIGMLFSASFMAAGILQLPLQLFWKMEQVSIALILARVSQLAVLVGTVFILYPGQDFTTFGQGIPAFMRILGSVLTSGIIQMAYVIYKGRQFLPLRWIRDRNFTRDIMKQNRQYGLAYYMSSFHTLIVLILLSNFFPTVQGYTYVGVRALALSLVEILVIIPSALGNSMIHKVSSASTEEKRKNFGALLTIIILIGLVVFVNFTTFHTEIIGIVGGKKYLATATDRGSDTLLPFFAIVLILSFVKQVFNYLFVSTHLQNKLLMINIVGVIIGVSIGTPLLLKYHLIGGIIMQLTLELCFTTGSILTARKNKVLPIVSRKTILSCIAIIAVLGTSGYLIDMYVAYQGYYRILTCLIMNLIILRLLWNQLKQQARLL